MPRPLAGLLLLLMLANAPALAEGDREFRHGDSRLLLGISPDYDRSTAQAVERWVDALSQSLLQVYGRWPRREWRVDVAPASARGADPVPWGRIHRGEVNAVELYTAPRASLGELLEATTGYHELAHLLIPYRGWGDAWFSEGLATYYQQVLQARSGLLSETAFWQSLYDGFAAGRADPRFAGQPLADIDVRLHRDGGHLRIYWSGAWYFLNTDVRLRRQSRGQQSLDTALDTLNRCCADQALSVPEMVEQLDTRNGVLLFVAAYREILTTTNVPDSDALFASLGIEVIDGRVRLQQFGPGAALRRTIVETRPL